MNQFGNRLPCRAFGELRRAERMGGDDAMACEGNHDGVNGFPAACSGLHVGGEVM